MSLSNNEKLFIFHDENDIIELLGRKTTKIQNYFDDKPIRVELSLGVDEKVIVQKFQIIR